MYITEHGSKEKNTCRVGRYHTLPIRCLYFTVTLPTWNRDCRLVVRKNAEATEGKNSLFAGPYLPRGGGACLEKIESAPDCRLPTQPGTAIWPAAGDEPQLEIVCFGAVYQISPALKYATIFPQLLTSPET